MSKPPDNESPWLRLWDARDRARPRRSPKWLLVLAVVLVAAAVAAGAVMSVHPWRHGRSAVQFAPCTYYGHISARCGSLLVPEDPADRHGRKIALHLAVIPATRQPPAGALFYLEGGPGGAATDSAVMVNEVFAQVSRDRDLVMVDERGTGESNRIACPRAHVPADDAAVVTSYLRRCFARLGAAPTLYTTSAAADDLEAVRHALGYGRVDLFGGSYGATLAQVYLHRYPDSVRSAVLDGASLLDVSLYERSAANAQHALDAELARCAATPACQRAFPHERQELAVLLTRGPRRVTTDFGTFVLRPDDVAATVAALLRSPEDAASIPYMVHAAAHGDYVPLARTYAVDLGADLDPRAQLATFWVILCSEPWAGFDLGATARDGVGSFLAHASLARARLFGSACRVVPRAAVPDDVRADGVIRSPVLLLAGSADPVDPVGNIHGWKAVFPNGRLIVVSGGGHGVIDRGCLPALVARFVARGTASGLDASCARRIELPPFATG
ncbi:MAG TPA: alpha/beta fold hydrolase [Gaiellaceae bacterium]|nr:alpha/beta fold hydrolase [Gaiellaceae bacterium]